MFRFKIFGIPVMVEPWFWLTMAFIGGGTSVNSKDSLLGVVLFIMAGFISILVHEIGHALMVRRYKFPAQIVLTAFGGYVPCPSNLSRKQSFLVTAAGPGIQFLLGFLALAVIWNVNMPSQPIEYFTRILCGISFVWAIFNCLPIFPMDGGQMFAAILGPRRAKVVHVTGVVCAALLGVLAISYNLWIAAIFMGFFAYQNYQLLQRAR